MTRESRLSDEPENSKRQKGAVIFCDFRHEINQVKNPQLAVYGVWRWIQTGGRMEGCDGLNKSRRCSSADHKLAHRLAHACTWGAVFTAHTNMFFF